MITLIMGYRNDDLVYHMKMYVFVFKILLKYLDEFAKKKYY